MEHTQPSHVPVPSISLQRASAALASLFVGDSLAMPVHWFYDTADIERAFPGGTRKLEAAPEFHPSSIMSLHSTRRGGRSGQDRGLPDSPEIVGMTPRRPCLPTPILVAKTRIAARYWGGIVSLSSGRTVDEWFEQLVDYQTIRSEIAVWLSPFCMARH